MWIVKVTMIINTLLILFRMGLFGAAHGWEAAKSSPPLKSVTHILQ